MMDEPHALTDPRLFTALERAAHFSSIDRHDLAERELRAALALAPDEPAIHVELARALDGQSKAEEAEKEGKVALHLDPEDIGAMALLARLCMNLGRHQESEQWLLQALRLEPEAPGLYLMYGALMQKTGHLDKAEKLLRRSLALDPEESHAHGLLSLVLEEKKRAELAKAHGEFGVYLEPGAQHSHAMLGYTYLRTGHPFKARRHLREAMRIAPDDTDVEEAFLAADRATRWTYLPMYYWSLWVSRIPGKQFTVWGVALILAQILPRLGVPGAVVGGLMALYVLTCIYTWVATPLTNTWIKMRPPR